MNFLSILTDLLPTKKAYAHCDIPCGIYDPHIAQMAAHTVIRMTKMIQDLKLDTGENDEELKRSHQQIARLVKVKEEHAELVKHEVRVIWGDFFKQEHLEKSPELHELVFNIMKLASKSRQEVDVEVAKELLVKVQEFSEVFFKAKGLESTRVKAPYPTEGEIVINK